MCASRRVEASDVHRLLLYRKYAVSYAYLFEVVVSNVVEIITF